MGFKCKIKIILILSVIITALVLMITICAINISRVFDLKSNNDTVISILGSNNRSDVYKNQIISKLNKDEKFEVQEVFDFDFDCAYVFDDCYISGTGFAKSHNLDISIEEVRPGTHENICRIVFVNSEGEFVYEFKCDTNELNIHETGLIIFPTTIIKKCQPKIDGQITFEFFGADYY